MRRHIPALDGLRGVAILGVLVAHSCRLAFPNLRPYTRFGALGVDLFFVLSGFLITGILLDTVGTRRYFRRFYVRRALRIWPLYYLVLVLAFAVVPHWSLWIALRPERATWWPYYVLFLQNLFLREFAIDVLVVSWSLAIEEQFYVVWPLVVRLVPRRRLGAVLATLALAGPALRQITLRLQGDWLRLNFWTWCHLDGLVLGALVAWWVRAASANAAGLRRWGSIGLGLGVGAFFVPAVAPRLAGLYGAAMTPALVAAGFTGVLALALEGTLRGGRLAQALSAGWLRYVGRVSYGLYLWHPFVFSAYARIPLVRRVVTPLPPVERGAIMVTVVSVLLFGVATASWYLFEAPILRLKTRWAPDDGR